MVQCVDDADYSEPLLKSPHLTGGGLCTSEFDMDVLLSIQMRKSQAEPSRDLWQQVWSMNFLKVLKCLP